jgi:hypothetical protein
MMNVTKDTRIDLDLNIYELRIMSDALEVLYASIRSDPEIPQTDDYLELIRRALQIIGKKHQELSTKILEDPDVLSEMKEYLERRKTYN